MPRLPAGRSGLGLRTTLPTVHGGVPQRRRLGLQRGRVGALGGGETVLSVNAWRGTTSAAGNPSARSPFSPDLFGGARTDVLRMPAKHKAWRSSLFCAPLWAVSTSLWETLNPAGSRRREKLPRTVFGLLDPWWPQRVEKEKLLRGHGYAGQEKVSSLALGRWSHRRCCCSIAPSSSLSLPWDCSGSGTWTFWAFFSPEGPEHEQEPEPELEDDDEPASEVVYLRFENRTSSRVAVLWLSNSGEEKLFYTLNKGCSITQETSVGNVWHVREDTAEQRLICVLKVKDNCVKRQLFCFTPLPQGKALDPSQYGFPQPDVRIPECYSRVLETDLGIPVVGHCDVSKEALHAAADIIRHMLKGCRPSILKALQANQCKVALISRNRVTTDILEHSHLRGSDTSDGRDWDVGVRGLGGTRIIPTCTVGEENVLRAQGDSFGLESILVHEFGHTVMEIALGPKHQQRIKDCFERNKHRYTAGIYMVADDKEYWAEGTQAWFDASLRNDVNDGINTRAKLKKHDPELASLLREVYGKNKWTYDFQPYRSPNCLTM